MHAAFEGFLVAPRRVDTGWVARCRPIPPGCPPRPRAGHGPPAEHVLSARRTRIDPAPVCRGMGFADAFEAMGSAPSSRTRTTTICGSHAGTCRLAEYHTIATSIPKTFRMRKSHLSPAPLSSTPGCRARGSGANRIAASPMSIRRRVTASYVRVPPRNRPALAATWRAKRTIPLRGAEVGNGVAQQMDRVPHLARSPVRTTTASVTSSSRQPSGPLRSCSTATAPERSRPGSGSTGRSRSPPVRSRRGRPGRRPAPSARRARGECAGSPCAAPRPNRRDRSWRSR